MFGRGLPFFGCLIKKSYIVVLAMVLFSFGASANICSSFFNQELSQNSYSQAFKIYDPNSTTSLIRALSNRRLESLKKVNPRTTNLSFFDDYLAEGVKRLKHFIQTSNDIMAKKEARRLIKTVKNKIINKQVTYQWILEFSSSYAYLFSDGAHASRFSSIASEHQIIIDYRNVALKWYSSGLILIPTFAMQDFNNYFDMEGRGYAVLGIRDSIEIADGKIMNPIQFLIHDYGHAEVIRGDEFPAQYKIEWNSINNKISNKISKLKSLQKKATEALYFYILHEQPSLRNKLIQSIIVKDGLSASHFFESGFFSQKTQLDSGSFYSKIKDPKDLGASFTNEAPDEVTNLAKLGFLKILKEIERSTVVNSKNQIVEHVEL